MHTTSNGSSLLLISRCLSFTWGSPCKLAFIELYYYLWTSQVGLICIHQVFGIRALPTATKQHQAHQFWLDARTLVQIYVLTTVCTDEAVLYLEITANAAMEGEWPLCPPHCTPAFDTQNGFMHSSYYRYIHSYFHI